jgi:hypothetical protein
VSHFYNLFEYLKYVRSGKLKWERLLDLLKYLKYDNNELPWMAGFDVIEELVGRLKFNTDVFAKFKVNWCK